MNRLWMLGLGALLIQLFTAQRAQATSCPPPRESLAGQAQQLRAQATSICDRAEVEHLLALNSEGQDDGKQAALAVRTWQMSGDIYRAAVEGLKLYRELRQHREHLQLRALRFALLQLSVHAAQAVDLQRDSTWLEWATGVSRDSDGNARTLSLAHAIDDADWTPAERRFIRGHLHNLQHRLIQRELSIASQHSSRGRTIAALTRIEGLYRWPGLEQSPHFELVLTEALRLQLLLIHDSTLESREERAKLARSSAAETPSSAEIRTQLRNRACALIRHWRSTRSPGFLRQDVSVQTLCGRR